MLMPYLPVGAWKCLVPRMLPGMPLIATTQRVAMLQGGYARRAGLVDLKSMRSWCAKLVGCVKLCTGFFCPIIFMLES